MTDKTGAADESVKSKTKRGRTQYHDAVVLAVLGDMLVAKEFLRYVLTEDVLSKIDLEKLERCNERDRVGERTLTNDLVFLVPVIGSKMKMLIIVEHYSTVDTDAVVRLHGTITARCLKAMSEAKNKEAKNCYQWSAGIILSNADKAWPQNTSLQDKFRKGEFCPETLRKMPQWKPWVLDLSDEPDQKILNSPRDPEFKLLLLLQRHIRDTDLHVRVHEWDEEWKKILQDSRGKAILEALLGYIDAGATKMNYSTPKLIREIRELFGYIPEPAKGSAAWHRRKADLKEGEKKGEKKGLKGSRDILEQQLVLRFGALPEPVRAKIGSANLEQLKVWSSRFVFAKDLNEIFE
jgi:hypothetical protein